MSASLRDARRDRGLTLEQVADAVGVSTGSLSLYERGKIEPRPDAARRIAEFFGVRQSEFWPTAPTGEEAA